MNKDKIDKACAEADKAHGKAINKAYAKAK